MKNIKGFITNMIAILVGILTYVFLSQPYMSYEVQSGILGAGSSLEGLTGYQFISNMDSENAKIVIIGIANLIVAIIAGLLILFAIFNMLTSTGTVKVKNPKFTHKINIINSVILVLISVVVLICAILLAGDNNVDAGIFFSSKPVVAWALFVNFALAFVALCVVIIASLGIKVSKNRKKKK